MGTKKIAYTVEVGVKTAAVKSLVESAEEYLMDQYELKIKLKDNPDAMALIEKGIKAHIDYSMEDLWFDEVVDCLALEKLFKKEIQEAQDKYEAQRAAEYEATIAERQKTAGVLRMHPDKLAEAKKLLKAAGIEATL